MTRDPDSPTNAYEGEQNRLHEGNTPRPPVNCAAGDAEMFKDDARQSGDASLPTTSYQLPPSGSKQDSFAQRYKLIESIGEGDMGTVWRASQVKPVRREVAFKMIKPGMDSKSVLARFDAERQALAIMDHLNIACVLDGGVTNDGHPYFVMELVRGLPLTE